MPDGTVTNEGSGGVGVSSMRQIIEYDGSLESCKSKVDPQNEKHLPADMEIDEAGQRCLEALIWSQRKGRTANERFRMPRNRCQLFQVSSCS
jgi:hypothetical protein